MSQLQIFLIGAGHIARAHANTAIKLANIYDRDLKIFVADPFEGARTSFVEQFPNAQAFATPEEMLAIPATPNDIAIIATPPFLHRDGALLALESGRHTLVEKPVAPTLQDALDIASKAHEKGLHWGECSMRLHNMPNTRELRKRIEAGEIGDVYHVNHVYKGGWSRPGIEYQPQSKWFLDKKMAGGGILVDWGVYDLANLTFLLSPIKIEIRAAWKAQPKTPADPTDIPFDVETHVGAAMIWHLKNGNRVHVNYERASGTHSKSQHFSEVVGTEGAYNFDWSWKWEGPFTKSVYTDGKNAEMPETITDEWEKEWEIDQGQRPLVVFFKKAILGEDLPALMNDDALFNFRVLCGLFEASETGNIIVVE